MLDGPVEGDLDALAAAPVLDLDHAVRQPTAGDDDGVVGKLRAVRREVDEKRWRLRVVDNVRRYGVAAPGDIELWGMRAR